MKAPKNYYNTVDQAKLGLDQIDKNKAAIAELQNLPVLPTPGEGDLGKVPKVNSEGGYTLAADEGLPTVTAADNTSVLQVTDGEWALRTLASQSFIATNNYGNIVATSNTGIKISISATTVTKQFFGVYVNQATLITKCNLYQYPILIDNLGNFYRGIVINTASDTINALVYDANNDSYIASITSTTIVFYKSKPETSNIPITIDGMTGDVTMNAAFSDVFALLDAGKVVKFIDGADVYVVHDFTNVGIKAYCFDLDLLDLYVKEINIPSTGPGTYTMVTFTGTT